MKKTIIALMALGTCAMGATTLSDAVYSAVGNNVNEETAITGSGSFTVTYTLDVTALDKLKLTGATLDEFKNYSLISVSGAGTDKHVGSALGYSSVRIDDNGNIVQSGGTAYVKAWGIFQQAIVATDNGIHSGNYYGGNNLITANPVTLEGMTAADDLSKLNSISVTQVHTDGTSSAIYTTLIWEDNTVNTFTATNTSLKWSSNNTGVFGAWDYLGVNTELVNSVYLFSDTVNADTAWSLNTAAAAALVPEPTTATLSLLALAGLAIRRRRR
ncbi:MAG: PEP-CTERM sorting domain-containing protein [Akkermansia sp.]|nr:PEP-CTERM sorting domain-containing protein [Akkermansia sp.]